MIDDTENLLRAIQDFSLLYQEMCIAGERYTQSHKHLVDQVHKFYDGLKNQSSDKQPDSTFLPEGYVSVDSFCDCYPIISTHAIKSMFSNCEAFRHSCGYRLGRKWYIHSQNSLKFFQEAPTGMYTKIKNKMRKMNLYV